MARPDPSELRRHQEERMENGVKNLKVARLIPKIYTLAISDTGYGYASSLSSLAEEIDEERSTHDCSDDSDG